MTVTRSQRRKVIERAGDCCEYCRVGPFDETSPFSIDHIMPTKYGGGDEMDNLALSCFQCNAYKGSNMAAADPQTGEAIFLFNPREHVWTEHFTITKSLAIEGKSAIGRTTVAVMRINDEKRVQYRQLAAKLNEFPCVPE